MPSASACRDQSPSKLTNAPCRSPLNTSSESSVARRFTDLASPCLENPIGIVLAPLARWGFRHANDRGPGEPNHFHGAVRAGGICWNRESYHGIKGTVVTSAPNNKEAVVPGATVVLNGRSVSFRGQANAAGAYVFAVFPAGSYTIRVSAPNMAEEEKHRGELPVRQLSKFPRSHVSREIHPGVLT